MNGFIEELTFGLFEVSTHLIVVPKHNLLNRNVLQAGSKCKMSRPSSPMDVSCNASSAGEIISTVSTAGSDVASCAAVDQELAIQKESA